jgi:hypothetical protein
MRALPTEESAEKREALKTAARLIAQAMSMYASQE